ncbi:unnamed protein product [Rotaria socialis]
MCTCISEIKEKEMKTNALKLFRTAVTAADPYECVKQHLIFHNNNQLNDDNAESHIGNNHITFNHNLSGIYSSWNSSFDFYEGAENNLPDQAAMNTAQIIEKMVSNTVCTDDILLVLISGTILYTIKNKTNPRL